MSCASTSTVYFYAFGVTRAKNFWFESMTFLYSNPLMCRKRSAPFLVLFYLIDAWRCTCRIFCICSRACNLSLVSSFGVASFVSVTLVISGVTVSTLGCVVRSSDMFCCVVLLLVWNTGPSWVGVREHLNWLVCPMVVLPVWRDSQLLCFRLLISI